MNNDLIERIADAIEEWLTTHDGEEIDCRALARIAVMQGEVGGLREALKHDLERQMAIANAECNAAAIAQRRVSELEAALLCVRPFLTTLTRQGEDNIWRPAKRLLAMIEEQIGPDRSAALAKDETARG